MGVNQLYIGTLVGLMGVHKPQSRSILGDELSCSGGSLVELGFVCSRLVFDDVEFDPLLGAGRPSHHAL